MFRIAIISSSVRIDRNSHRLALFFRDFISKKPGTITDLIDLSEFRFPIFEERLMHIKNPTPEMLEFAYRISVADGVLIVTPEYNGGYPASLKNVIDLLYMEWRRKPVSMATVSSGPFGGSRAVTSLMFNLWTMGAWIVPAMYFVPEVQNQYKENGEPVNRPETEKRAAHFIEELCWSVQARKKMESKLPLPIL